MPESEVAGRRRARPWNSTRQANPRDQSLRRLAALPGLHTAHARAGLRADRERLERSGSADRHERRLPSYRVSKIALNAVTRILADELTGSGNLVNAADVGRVRTDMGGPNARSSVEEGADTPVWLATLADDGPTGGFFRERRETPW
jgi:NAD(P)-dependent dehydrogenase (short-subunit alcohol dehydrogenase family)